MRYPGGKGGCFRRLINFIPPHSVYIETHLGGGAVMRAKRPAIRSIGIDLDPKVIEAWKDHSIPSLQLHTTDAKSFLEKYRFGNDEFVYVDPPYLRDTRRRWRVYSYDYTERDHEQLLDCLKCLPCAVMLSGYASRLYDETLKSWQRIDFTSASHVGLRTESVWINYEPPVIPHDLAYLGHDFRAREQVKRRHSRLLKRISSLSVQEQVLLLEALQSRLESMHGPNELSIPSSTSTPQELLGHGPARPIFA